MVELNKTLDELYVAAWIDSNWKKFRIRRKRMSILSAASDASVWRGYEYYEKKKVLSWKQTGEHEYEGEVAGSGKKPYHVMIDTEHSRRSTCDCPLAKEKE